MSRATYFDGKTSKPYDVEVVAKRGGLVINSRDEWQPFSHFYDSAEITVQSLTSADHLMLKLRNEFPSPSLQWEGPEAMQFANEHLRNKNKIKHAEFLITRGKPLRVVLVSMLVLVATVCAYIFYVSPWVGDQAVRMIPPSVEEKAGNVMFNNMRPFIRRDSAKTVLINEFYDVCGFTSEYDVDITYSSSSMVNAFAVPGGKIVVFDGIVDETQNWEELAALLGHELAHVNQRHSFKMLSRSFSSYFFISVLTGDVAGTSAVILDNASQIHNMANSRGFEKEADVTGLDYLQELQIDPQGMVNLFKRLETELELGDFIDGLEYLSTHPLTENRIDYLQELIDTQERFDYEGVQIERAKEIWEQLKEMSDYEEEIEVEVEIEE